MLDVSNLTLKYGQSQILQGVSMQAKAGKVTCIMGTNGVGKTSLLRAIAGRHPYDKGTLSLNGRALAHPSAVEAARAGIAYVPQGREIFPLMSVTENLETGFSCLPGSGHRVPDRIYDLFPVLKTMKDRRGGDLSGGQQQQLAIARALITQPKVLLLDEPTEGIQPNIITQIGEVIEALRADGEMAIVLVEQYFDFAVRLADHFLVLNRGEVTLSGTRKEVSNDILLEKLAL